MGKYTQRNIQAPQQRDENKIHPIWRGVGFILMIVVPLMGYAITSLIIQENKVKAWFVIPAELRGPAGYTDLWITILGTIVITLVLFVIITFLYFLTKRIVAPTRYGPFDVKPIQYHGKPYKR